MYVDGPSTIPFWLLTTVDGSEIQVRLVYLVLFNGIFYFVPW